MKLTYADTSNPVYKAQCPRCRKWYYSDTIHECRWKLRAWSPPPLEERQRRARESAFDAIEDLMWTYGRRWPLVLLRVVWRALRRVGG